MHLPLASPRASIDLFTVYDATSAGKGGGGGGVNMAKITVNVWDFGPLGTTITLPQRGGFPQQKCILKDIYTEIIFIKYKEEIQVIMTVNKFLRFYTNPSNKHYANYHKIRSDMRRFTI